MEFYCERDYDKRRGFLFEELHWKKKLIHHPLSLHIRYWACGGY